MATSCVSTNNNRIVNEVSDEKLEEVYTPNEDAVQLVNNGRTFQTVKVGFFHSATGKNSYSSGIHCIRIKLHHGTAFFGIRSCNIKPVPDITEGTRMYIKSPSTYGWLTNGGRLVNGRFDAIRLADLDREGAIFVLTINCDERRLTIVINENSLEQDEMEIDGLHAPYPWCLFVQLNRVGARISLL